MSKSLIGGAIAPNEASLDFLAHLVCGLPSERREHRLFAMLTAYIDGSDNEPTGHVFVLAGFVASRQRWDAFIEQWNVALTLAKPRPIKYFKMVEANSLKGQFLGWGETERDLKLRELASIIKTHAQFAVRATLGWNDFLEVQNQSHWMGCCRFQRHRVRCMHETGGAAWSDASVRESSKWRR